MAEVTEIMDKMVRMIALGRPFEDLGADATAEARVVWDKIAADIAEMRKNGIAVQIPVDF